MVTGLEQLSCEEGWREPGSFSLEKRRLDAPSLQAFQARLDVALGSLGCWLLSLHTAGVGTDSHCGPFQPRPSYESVILLVLMVPYGS